MKAFKPTTTKNKTRKYKKEKKNKHGNNKNHCFQIEFQKKLDLFTQQATRGKYNNINSYNTTSKAQITDKKKRVINRKIICYFSFLFTILTWINSKTLKPT